MKKRYHRMDQRSLNEEAKYRANAEQRPVLDKMLETGFNVTKIVSDKDRSAICLAYRDTSGWLTLDGKFHRPVKGKKHVAINTTTLERIW